MAGFSPKDPDWRARCEDSFARQALMSTMGAGIDRLQPGQCTLSLAHRPDLCQQHGYLHAGTTMALADTAAGYAAFSLMPKGASVLTTELKINLLNPAAGERLEAVAEVVKPGRTLSVVKADVYGIQGGKRGHVATVLATMMCLADTPDDKGR
ncbi:PaaI family thioesterase [Magnetospirillum moscoviense]|uniref:Medium/long-chain acyl-CoA thioesterase YigI n=1 Tax=Magnetospirillum moscoviense TaxID=1437059 RepID=A0A178MPC4_9PROT|nr:PaaI family thioesterase [Magnetospirillum moscoviense]OAN50479.1 thioesterase [Magnetospirillum moscoviense]